MLQAIILSYEASPVFNDLMTVKVVAFVVASVFIVVVMLWFASRVGVLLEVDHISWTCPTPVDVFVKTRESVLIIPLLNANPKYMCLGTVTTNLSFLEPASYVTSNDGPPVHAVVIAAETDEAKAAQSN